MAYVLNLVLGTWIRDLKGKPVKFFVGEEWEFGNISDAVKSWNKHGGTNTYWPDIHYPAIKEHFEVYEKLPDNWKG